jgi:hypothetical protein
MPVQARRRPGGRIPIRIPISDLLLERGRRAAVPRKNISIRLPLTDLERARNLAAQRGDGYQAVINSLLHEALKKELKIASKQSTKSRD